MSYWRTLQAFFGGETSNVAEVRIDASTHSLMIVDYEHHEIHSGSSFIVTDVVPSVDAATQKWHITTPSSLTYAHAVFDIESDGEISVAITEGSDRAGAVNLPEINRRRVGTPTAATVSVSRGTTGGTTDGATTIYTRLSGSTSVSGKSTLGGGARSNNEFVLKPNTGYVVAVTTLADVYVSFAINWYEHADKD